MRGSGIWTPRTHVSAHPYFAERALWYHKRTRCGWLTSRPRLLEILTRGLSALFVLAGETPCCFAPPLSGPSARWARRTKLKQHPDVGVRKIITPCVSHIFRPASGSLAERVGVRVAFPSALILVVHVRTPVGTRVRTYFTPSEHRKRMRARARESARKRERITERV